MAETYSLRGIKFYRLKKQQSFYHKAILFHGDKPVAMVTSKFDENVQILWNDRFATKVPVSFINNYHNPCVYQGTPEEASFAAYCLSLPEEEGMKQDFTSAINKMLLASEEKAA
jgi:hypothetical protein